MLAIRSILHPTDFSESSAAAFRLASALAQDYAARLIVLYVYPPPFNGAEEVDRGRPDGIEEDISAKLHQLKPHAPGVEVVYRAEEGHPAEMILAVAEAERADLIVLGTHGRSGVGRAVMGSVAEAVSRKATAPVVTVRPAARVAPELVEAGARTGC
jgi:nucleotide-binding universal stress UspA family protein